MATHLPAQPVIRFAAGLYDILMASVGQLEPEHYAILSGHLDDPLRVTDIRPMPPAFDDRGRHRASGAAVTLNGPFIEYYLNTELLPFGKYPLGAIHSHPGDYTRLSGTVESRDGDVPTMRGHLQKAAALGKPWQSYLAPIVTAPGDSPTITGWIVRLDHDQPIPAEIVWEREAVKEAAAMPNSPETALTVLNRWQGPINNIAHDRRSPPEDRSYAMNLLRRLRDRDVRQQFGD